MNVQGNEMKIPVRKKFVVTFSVVFLVFASIAMPVIVSSANTSSTVNPVGLGVLFHFTFSGTSERTGSVAISAGQFYYYTQNRSLGGGAAGYGQVIDNQSGKDGFAFKFVKLVGQNSICTQKNAINLNAVVTSVRGNGLHMAPKSSLAVLLRCFSPNSMTIVSPSCTAGVPACLVAVRLEDTFSGTLKIN
jgi:hypothetical protein